MQCLVCHDGEFREWETAYERHYHGYVRDKETVLRPPTYVCDAPYCPGVAWKCPQHPDIIAHVNPGPQGYLACMKGRCVCEPKGFVRDAVVWWAQVMSSQPTPGRQRVIVLTPDHRPDTEHIPCFGSSLEVPRPYILDLERRHYTTGFRAIMAAARSPTQERTWDPKDVRVGRSYVEIKAFGEVLWLRVQYCGSLADGRHVVAGFVSNPDVCEQLEQGDHVVVLADTVRSVML